MKACILIALLINSASAQSYSGHSGWSFEDTRQKATDVVVADAISGTVADTGSQVSVKATLRVVRTLAGMATPGAEVAVEWQYHPIGMGREAPLPKDPPLRGIWFWRKGADGKPELLQATWHTISFGGYYLPAGTAPLYYRSDAPLGQKIACELEPLLEDFVAQHAAELAQPSNIPGPAAQTRGRFNLLTISLDALGKDGTAEVWARLSSHPSPWLKLIGITGRLKTGDAGALADLEQNLPALDPVLRSGNMPPPMAIGLDIRNNLPAAHSLGRLALAETLLPGIEGQASWLMAQTHSLEVLPYFVTMLESPSPSTRGAALMAFCQTLGPGYSQGAIEALWQPTMRDHCPRESPVRDRDAELRDIRYWKDWWAEHREAIAKRAALPQVFPPARYRTTQNTELREVPMEMRFQSLVSMATRQTEHYHDASGKIIEGQMPGPHDPLLSRIPEADREVYQSVLTTTHAKLDQCDEKARAIMDQARVAGTMPSRESYTALSKERDAALKAGMAEMQSRLSPDGWKVVENFLKGMNIVGASPTGK